jgi:hypothetical protein
MLTGADGQLAAARDTLRVTRERIANAIALLEQRQTFEAVLLLKNLHDFTLGEPSS